MLTRRAFAAAGAAVAVAAAVSACLPRPAVASFGLLGGGAVGSGTPTSWFGATYPTLPLGVSTTDYFTFTGKTVNTTYSLPTPAQTNNGAYFYPTDATTLQTALNTASQAGNGDVIVLPHASAITTTTTLTLRNNSAGGTGTIYIIPDTLDPTSASYNPTALPVGTRVGPSNVSDMATIYFNVSGGIGINSDNSAHHYRLAGINLDATGSSAYVYYALQLGHGDTSTTTLCTDITMDRCIIHGDATYGCRHGFNIDGIRIEATECYFYNCFAYQNDTDAQAVWLGNSTGPYLVYNCYLEASVECMLAGGSGLSIPNAIMSDAMISHCTFQRNNGSTVSKNLLEIKTARRWLIDSCYFNNMYETSNQRGQAINLSNVDNSGVNMWVVVEDIVISNCYLNDCVAGVLVNGQAGTGYPIGSRYLIRNLLHYVADPSGADNGSNHTYQFENNPNDVVLDHVTMVNNAGFGVAQYILLVNSLGQNWVMSNSIWDGTGSYGFGPSGWATSAADYLTDPACIANAIYNDTGYPSGNYYPASEAAIGFTNVSGKDFTLSGTSPYKGIGVSGANLPYTSAGVGDGSDLGANTALIPTS